MRFHLALVVIAAALVVPSAAAQRDSALSRREARRHRRRLLREQLWFPSDSLRVVVFTNATVGDPGRLARNLAFRVCADGDHLTAQANARAPFALVYLGDDSFGSAIDPRWRLTMRVENGRAVYATRRSADGTAKGPRQR